MGLLIAAAFTTALVLCGLAVLLVKARDWHAAAIAFAVALPLQPLAFFLVRLPIDRALKDIFGGAAWLVVVALFYAPFTEEPAKWLTALVPAVRRAIATQPVTQALAVGLGFGIGEIWFLASALVLQPNYPDLPPWMFGGFVVERLEVCFLHGALITPAFVLLARGGRFWLGALIGTIGHFCLNFPIYLAQQNAFGLGAIWVSLLLLWVFGFVLAGALMCVFLANRYASRPDAPGPD